MANKRIGLVLSSLPGYSETFFRSKIKGLQKNGFEVILFVNEKSPKNHLNCAVHSQLSVPGSSIARIVKLVLVVLMSFLTMPGKTMSYIKTERASGASARKALENLFINYHILKAGSLSHLHFGFSTMAVRREHLAKTLEARLSVSFRGYDIMVYPNTRKEVYKKLWSRVDKIHSLSNALIETAQKHYHLPESVNTQIITPAVDLKLFGSEKTSRKEKDRIRLITVSRLHWVKGIEYLLKAVSISNKNGIDCTLEIIGDGDQYDRMVFAAHQLGVLEKVTFHGKKSHEEISTFLSAADVYVQYSNSEGFCNAVLEAQAMGIPCLVSDAGGLPENVVDGQTGWIVAKRKPEALAQGILKAAELSEDQLAEMGQHARQRVRSEYNLEKQEAEFVQFFAE